jgi:hypothetical protein
MFIICINLIILITTQAPAASMPACLPGLCACYGGKHGWYYVLHGFHPSILPRPQWSLLMPAWAVRAIEAGIKDTMCYMLCNFHHSFLPRPQWSLCLLGLCVLQRQAWRRRPKRKEAAVVPKARQHLQGGRMARCVCMRICLGVYACECGGILARVFSFSLL